ncbi:MAG: nitrogen fixation negative regulator NifL [Parasulfuritortus sp.]|jgi:nitrogen fixation negative regulator NifL|nr:nitrogen fixation negative regulator NifL [Parasulfuritortus sp.]
MDESNPTEATVPLEIFKQVVEQAALAISITDAQAHILYSNPAFQRVTGYDVHEITGNNESLLSYKVTPKIVYETMWAQLLRQRPWNGLLVNRRKDGNRYLADLTITPVVGDEGKTTHYLGMHRDVTEVHRLERQVQNQKTLIESVVDAAPVAIVMLDDTEKVILDNQEYKKLIGELGPEPAAILLGALHASLGADYDNAKKSGRGFVGREVRHAAEGRKARWFSCSGSWIEEQDSSADAFYEPARRQYMLMVIQDITALKEQQEAIRVTALRAMLAEQERIQGLREVLSGAIFQLQGPFNMLAAAVRMLERQNGGNPADSLTASLEEALAQGNRTLETLRACVPSQAEETPTLIDLNAILKDMLRLVTPRLLADGITVEWQPAGNIPLIPGRPTRLASLFKALLENALDAIHESRGERRELKVSTTAHPDRVEVLVEDSGPGVPDEWRYKAFEPFFTTKGAERQHIGMGLTVAQEVAAGHGGLISLDNLPGGGCRACVQLPVA